MKTLLLLFAFIASLFFEGAELVSSLLEPSSWMSSDSSIQDSKGRKKTQNNDISNNARYSLDDFKDIPPN
jgi:hypothetical protein